MDNHSRKKPFFSDSAAANLKQGERPAGTGVTEDMAAGAPAKSESIPELTDADLPPLESLDADSDYTGFLSTKVSEGIRRAALRKLFHTDQFNVIDELDEYAEDFTTFAALGDVVTSDMRHQMEIEARRMAERLNSDEQASIPDKLPLGDSTADGGEQENSTPASRQQEAETRQIEHSVCKADASRITDQSVREPPSRTPPHSLTPEPLATRAEVVPEKSA